MSKTDRNVTESTASVRERPMGRGKVRHQSLVRDRQGCQEVQRSAGLSGGPEIGRGVRRSRERQGVRRSRARQRSTGESEKFGRSRRIILALCKAAIVAPRRPIRSAVEIVYRAWQIASTINVRNERVLSVGTYNAARRDE